MNFSFKSISFTLLKLLIVVISFVFINPILAEENLYDRGKELVEQKEYKKALKAFELAANAGNLDALTCLLYTSPSPRDGLLSRMPSSA